VDLAQRFAANLIELRGKAGLSQEELAFMASIHRTHVSQMESGKRLPRFETLVKLIGALDTSPEALMRGISWKPNLIITNGGLEVSDPR
jgi:transcriptional regulator with XRE-family HTH domain